VDTLQYGFVEAVANVSYVYPNVTGIPQRGGLLQRLLLANKLGCKYIEMPADFIKNKTEITRTGLQIGVFIMLANYF